MDDSEIKSLYRYDKPLRHKAKPKHVTQQLTVAHGHERMKAERSPKTQVPLIKGGASICALPQL